MGEMNSRIKQLRESTSLSRRKFAELIGTTERKMQNVEQELQRVQDDLLEKIIKQYPEYAYWLVTGLTIKNAGQISPQQKQQQQQQQQQEQEQKQEQIKRETAEARNPNETEN